MPNRSPVVIASALMVLLACAVFAAPPSGPVAQISVSPHMVQWRVLVPSDAVTLTVSGPDGETHRFESKGQTMNVALKDLGDATLDGIYVYDLVVTPPVSSAVKQKLNEARKNNDDAAARKAARDAGLDHPMTDSGAFSILNGSFVSPDVQEKTNGASASGAPRAATSTSTGTGGAVSASGRLVPVVNDQVIPDDLIVQGSECIGLDCINNESFGFDTLRLKENNTRIKFDDTSVSSGFPNVDWQLTANDSASGGANKFSIEDVSNARVPFTITAASPNNSVFVDSSGRLGLRTATPVLDIHVATSNTPGMRLEQNSSGGFTSQTWDIAGNEANFFVRDVTGGSRLPFRIRPGAPTSSIDIAASGFVGVGTSSPSQKLHVFENVDANTLLVIENSNAGASAAGVLRAKSDVATVNFQAHAASRTISRFGQTLGGWNEMLAVSGNGLILGTLGATPLILGTNSAARMTIDSAGSVTIPGNLTVSGVKNFAVADPSDSKRALYYAALEGPEAGTYIRGSAKTVNGEVAIELPGYFSHITETERMTVQLTPVGAWGQLYVAEKSPGKLVVKVAQGTPDLEFDYFVQGIRKGYLDYQVERPDAFPVK